MIHNSFSRTIGKLNEIIKELEETYKSFKMITIIPISSGYVLYYYLNTRREE